MHAVSDPSQSPAGGPPNESLAASEPARVLICLFGGLSIFKNGRSINWRSGARTEALLLSLALGPTRGVTRERLLAQVWPEADLPLAAQSLHSLLHTLHRTLAEAIDGAAPVLRDGEIYRLNFDAGITVDVTAFDALARRGHQAWGAGARLTAGEFYRQAVALYRGDLQVCRDDSDLVERERLRASYLAMLGRLADAARRDGDYACAIDHASLVLQYDAGREDAHRTLMACYAQLGQRVQAMRQYQLCARILRESFEAVPEPATQALFNHLRLCPGTPLEPESLMP